MHELSGPWLVALLLGSLLLVAGSAWPCRTWGRRWWALGMGGALLAVCVPLLRDALAAGGAALADPADPMRAMGRAPLLQVDVLSAILLPFSLLIFLATVGLTPRAALARPTVRRQSVGLVLLLLALSTRDPVVWTISWAGSIGVLLLELRGLAGGRPLRIAAAYLLPSVVALAVGLGLLAHSPRDSVGHAAGIVLVALAVMIRKGIFPLHSWVPEVFEHGRLSAVSSFCAPQLGAWVAVAVLVPEGSRSVLAVVAGLSILTAVYGALATLSQVSARRALGWLFVSQSALVLAGIQSDAINGLAGGLSVWLSSGLAFSGLALALTLLEARRGALRLDRLNGGYERMPLLAATFLTLGLACVGFPGTFGFVAQELLVSGVTEQFPHVGFLVVVASALTAIAVLRMYFSLFCGPDPGRLPLRLGRRELFFLVALAALTVSTGLAPGPLVSSRTAAAAELLKVRAAERAPASAPRDRPATASSR